MENAGYAMLTRHSGLSRELQVIANNIANLSTTGFRREGVMFSEFIRALDHDEPALSMAAANARQTYLTQGTLTNTGGDLDLAIEGDGFFLVETPEGEALTRAGNFSRNAAGEMVTADGHRLLDIGGAPVFVPADSGPISIARDGTVSANSQPLAQIGLVRPQDPAQLTRLGGALHRAEGPVDPVENPTMLQGFVEESNVNPITEMARLIAVQRAYERGQRFMDGEDQRIRTVIQTLGR